MVPDMAPGKRLLACCAAPPLLARSLSALGVLAAALTLLPTGAATPQATAAGAYRNGLIAFTRCCSSTQGIYVIRQDGTGERQIYSDKGDTAVLSSWSPNGKQVAFVAGSGERSVWIMDGDGARPRQVTPGRGGSSYPNWSPKGSWIIFSDNGAFGRDLYVVRPDGSGLKRLTRTREDETTSAWAPNGSEIVFERLNSPAPDGSVERRVMNDLWRMNPDGSGKRLLIRNASWPSWSPGGSSLAFIREGQPWVARADGSGARRVVKLARPQDAVAWSPDGRWLVVGPVGDGDLTLIRPNGSQTRPLTKAPEHFNGWPSWQRLP